jgi:hypothetical protein
MNTVAGVIEQIADDPAIFGLGDLRVCRCSCGGLLLEDPATASHYVVVVVPCPMDDGALIRLVERWAAVRRQHAGRRCFAVLVAETIEPHYRNLLAAISKAVPVVAMEMAKVDGALRLTPLSLF